MKKAKLGVTPIEPSNSSNFTMLTSSIKAKLLADALENAGGCRG